MISEETYTQMKKLISEYEDKHLYRLVDTIDLTKLPYLTTPTVKLNKEYNPQFGDDKVCICGHPYHRHFDSYEDMEAIGCKYCQCYEFIEK